MIKKLLEGVFGTRHSRELKRIQPILAEIARQGERLQTVDEATLRGQTAKFRGIIAERTADLEQRIAALKQAKHDAADAAERERIDLELGGADGSGGLEGELRQRIADTLDELLPEAFATVREAARRLVGSEVLVTGHPLRWDMVHYEVQLIGGIQLHLGKIAEMATGEGKTLVATLPLYLNALPGRGAHLVTVNSYLARRDSQWMGHLYGYLGLTVGCLDDTEPGSPERHAAYRDDITYGTNNEFGFDYLRDNMVVALEQRVQRPHVYAIVDEVDSVLIDEARTPLIISGPVGNDNDGQYYEHNGAVARLVKRQVEASNELVAEAEQALAAGDQARASVLLFKAQLGAPKNRRLLKLYQETGVKQLVQKMELSYIADRKLPASKQQYRALEDELLFVLDERGHSVHLTDAGVDFLSPADHDQFVLPDLSSAVHRLDQDDTLAPAEKLERRQALEREYAAKAEKLHIVHQLLRAHALYERDVNYVVQDGQVLIVDEFTGRTMPGRRWSEGLHQAVEAKEGVQVKGETQTLATITIQNYFRMYEKLGGMTGTAETEETEFHQIYGLEVAVIPTNRPIVRDDRQDLIFKTRREKYNAIVQETQRLHALGFPILVGTANVDVSETLSKMFKRAGIPHNVLNAKYHQREAEIVAEAGRPGAVTIATNMAGRGTDIKLGEGVRDPLPSRVTDPGSGKEVDITEIGGLHIIGSERHESRRIDRQLRGRAGRQGDPGASQFFLSLEDDLMRLFQSDRIAKLMDALGAQDGEVLTHPLITRSIEQAQKRVELQNFQARKRLLDYDDVMNQQREVIYSLRSFALEGGEELKGEARKMLEAAVTRRVELALGDAQPGDWDMALLRQELLMNYLLTVDAFADGAPDRPVTVADAVARAVAAAEEAFARKQESLGEFADRLLALVTLNVIDEKWKDHLYDLDQLRSAIHYRSWGQKDPLVEYKQEAYTMFVELMHDLQHTFAERFLKVQLIFQQEAPPPPPEPVAAPARRFDAMGVARPVDELDEVPPPAQAVPAPETPAPETPAPTPAAAPAPARRAEPMVVGAGRARSLAGGVGGTAVGALPPGTDLSKVGRNDVCPCGSGKKFKKCHGATL
jgi:preprotein translocase subunit SecA